ncbi:MAG: bifunctional phosphoribosylaminoimidazolecarboxamide formyltransferase/inosine monophosphate cyclohydrolase [Chlorobiaceae bacterium]|nr:bifunctional phosphoribosylaminoimidazolecarboxamide formyltransferase/inosine monophosphate cyclohydrolase [Chlorobiaceae bacterium]MBA4309724.1 bifunctional phosphoribosylaminoimidazolecarboxamide formyltransferase/inosine monophosphate cyclohydrolase [Chlorobiaceae bacterium]
MKKFALISVSDKTNIIEFAKELLSNNYNLLATGKTAQLLKDNSCQCIEIENFTNFPEIFDGRVKTLNPKIFGGILLRRENQKDLIEAKNNEIEPIDIVCVNLYPFEKVSLIENISEDELIENIDIGGPSLVRAAAKNCKYVSVLTDPNQYEKFIFNLNQNNINEAYKRELALAAFSHTAKYDTTIIETLEKKYNYDQNTFRINTSLEKKLRYGENPHQSGKIFGKFSEYFELIHGKEISYNNVLDIVASVELIEELEKNSCAIIKHNNPCGVSSMSNNYDSYTKALACDPVSAFGGIVAFNSEVDEKLAEKLNEIFLEVVIAPAFTDSALNLLKKKKERRIIKQIESVKKNKINFRSIPGGVLVQDADYIDKDFDNLKIVTDKKPTEKELADLRFAWIVCKNVKSNTIVFAKDNSTIGIGAGQVSRIDSAKIGAMKAKEFGFDLDNSVAASDAFFPFADGLLELIKNGISAVIQPGGSVRDNEVIEAANKNNITMVFTGIRHFKH